LGGLKFQVEYDTLKKIDIFAYPYDLSKFNTTENSQYWFEILEKQPQFAKQCDWTLINDYQKNKLKQIHPDIEIN